MSWHWIGEKSLFKQNVPWCILHLTLPNTLGTAIIHTSFRVHAKYEYFFKKMVCTRGRHQTTILAPVCLLPDIRQVSASLHVFIDFMQASCADWDAVLKHILK